MVSENPRGKGRCQRDWFVSAVGVESSLETSEHALELEKGILETHRRKTSTRAVI